MPAQALPYQRRQFLPELTARREVGLCDHTQGQQDVPGRAPRDVAVRLRQHPGLLEPVPELAMAAELLAQRRRTVDLAGERPARIARQRVGQVRPRHLVPLVTRQRPGELPGPAQLSGLARGAQRRQQLLGGLPGRQVELRLHPPPTLTLLQDRRQRQPLGLPVPVRPERDALDDVSADGVPQLAHVERHRVELGQVAGQHPQPHDERRRPASVQQCAQLARRRLLAAELPDPAQHPLRLVRTHQFQQEGQLPPVRNRQPHPNRPPLLPSDLPKTIDRD
ncbi:hypothetical protein [Streptacidiphilus sp. EB103A]|uniref:hypothetical protein n=1 Tax=Streptacidiphilus sp. EB103A TaxID=3156275 RepID=UPI003518DE0E